MVELEANFSSWIEPWTSEVENPPQEPIENPQEPVNLNQFSWEEFVQANSLGSPSTPSNTSSEDGENNQVSPLKMAFVLSFVLESTCNCLHMFNFLIPELCLLSWGGNWVRGNLNWAEKWRAF